MSIVVHFGAVQSEIVRKEMAAGTDAELMEASPAPVESAPVYPSVPQTTYPSCFGLPYQDHNYGAMPPPTPPQSPPPPPPLPQTTKLNGGHIDVVDETVNIVVAKAVSQLTQGSEGAPLDSYVDDSVTRCICDFQHDDGYMICCDKCSVWQHIDCMNIDRNNIPDAYCCEECEPRLVDKQKARELQTRKREEMTDSSATDTDPDEAAHHLALLKAQATANKKGKNKKVAKKDKNGIDGKPKKIKKEKREKKDRKERLSNTNSVDVTLTISKKKLQNNKENTKKPVQLKPNKKKNFNVDLQLDQTNDAWDSSSSPWVDGYEPGRCNLFSMDLQKMLANYKFNGQRGDDLKMKLGELRVQLCHVTEVKKNRKGLEATSLIVSNQPIVEFVGRVMMKEQFDTENIFNMLYPFVLFYSKFENTNLCIDARKYGNDARFVRRSCAPNAEVKHVVSSGCIRFYVFSTREISKGAEITIPFDYKYKECTFVVECACSKVNCAVSKKKKKGNAQKRTSKRRQAQREREEAALLLAATTPAVLDRPATSPVLRPDTSLLESLANAAEAVSMVEKQALAMERSSPVFVESPVKEECPVETGPVQENSLSNSAPTVDENDDQTTESSKKMTREERKMDAIMKAFEKLEKREERRKETLARMEVAKKVKGDKSEEVEPDPEVEVKPEVKPEPKSAQKGKRRKSHPARRRSRMSSGNSDCTVTSEDSNTFPTNSAPATPALQPELYLTQYPNNTAVASAKNFRFKTKRHLMNEWLSEKTQSSSSLPCVPSSLGITSSPGVSPVCTNATPTVVPNMKLEPLEVAVEETMFVTCLPSPRNTLEYMRRNSYNSGDKLGQSSSIGSAKKRWLRQAMCESTQSSDSGKESPAPYCDGTSPIHTASMPSPGASPPMDFVTPLKKRRLARESLSYEQPPTPSTLSPPLYSHAPGVGVGVEELATPTTTDTTPTVLELEDIKNKNGYRTSAGCPLTPVTPGSAVPEKSDLLPSCDGKAGVKVEHQESMDSECSGSLLAPPIRRTSQEISQDSVDSVADKTVKVNELTCSAGESHENALPGVANSEQKVSSCSDGAFSESVAVKTKEEPIEVPDIGDDKHERVGSVKMEVSESSECSSRETNSNKEESSTEIKGDNCVESSDNIVMAADMNVDRTMCSSTHTAETSLPASAFSADSSVVAAGEIARSRKHKPIDVDSNLPQPTSTAVLLDTCAGEMDTAECRGSAGLVDSAGGASNPPPSGSSEVTCSPPLDNSAERTAFGCLSILASAVSDSSSSMGDWARESGDNLHVESSVSIETRSSSGQHADDRTINPVDNSRTPPFDSLVSSTSQMGVGLFAATASACAGALAAADAREAISPGVSSTVSEVQRDHVSSWSGGSPRISGALADHCVTTGPAACDSSVGLGAHPQRPFGNQPLFSPMTVMFADSTSAVPPPPLPQTPPPPPPPPAPPPTPPPTKKKVSLLEYRKRLKDKGGNTPTKTCNSAPVTLMPERSTPTLAPLPLFNQANSPSRGVGSSPGHRKEADSRWGTKKREKPLSLSERLKMEFGLDDSDEDESSADKKREASRETSQTPPPPPPPTGVPPPPPPGKPAGEDPNMKEVSQHVAAGPARISGGCPIGVYPHPHQHPQPIFIPGPPVDPRTGALVPQPVPPPSVQSRLLPPLGSGQLPHVGRIPSLLSIQTFPSRQLQSHPGPSSHLQQSPQSSHSPHVFSQSPPPPHQTSGGTQPPAPIPPPSASQFPYQGPVHAASHPGGPANNTVQPSRYSQLQSGNYSTQKHPVGAATPASNHGYHSSNNSMSGYNMGPLARQGGNGQNSYGQVLQYPAGVHTPPAAQIAPPFTTATGGATTSSSSAHPGFPVKPVLQASSGAAAQSPQSQSHFSSRTSSSVSSTRNFNHKTFY